MSNTRLFEHRVGDITLRFLHDTATDRVGLTLYPTSLAERLVAPRPGLGGLPYIDSIPGLGNPPARVVDSIVQVKLVGDAYSSGFAQGRTMRGSASLDSFRLCSQEVSEEKEFTAVTSTLRSAAGHRIAHRLAWRTGESVIRACTHFHNESGRPVTLEMLSSFSLSGITPFHQADAPGRLRAHRFRSGWSAEGRLETQTVEKLHLERSWIGAAAHSERFGQVGTMPVRHWFPFLAVEDVEAGVVWGAELAWAGSWQMEIFRRHDDVCISGGLADREFGHWTKTLEPGESLTTPEAIVTCVRGDLDACCRRLTEAQQHAADAQPDIERDLPIVFNEWCTTWGEPEHGRIMKIADRLAGTDVRYLVIDAGWYKPDGSDWATTHGDWIPNARLFPKGLEATAKAIRERGLIPGLWFEMETVGSQSFAFTALARHMLHRDGIPVTSGQRRFWNLRDPKAIAYLTERVIDLLERCDFGYLKVDYNETLGIGCDGSDSLGEGLRQQVLASYSFFKRIRERLPNLVIENCASGGHRLEPSMLASTAMSSFSDAHEPVEIPIIAANLQSLIQPRQSLIWAVLHAADSMQRLAYSLAATFLGRMCLSGEVADLSAAQWDLAIEAQRFYRLAAPIVKRGISRRFGAIGESWRHPHGWQAVLRLSHDGKTALLVMHAFENSPRRIPILLEPGPRRIDRTFPEADLAIQGGEIRWSPPGDFSACAALLSLSNSTEDARLSRKELDAR